MKLIKSQLKKMIKEELEQTLKEVREYRPDQREGSFVLQDDGTFELTLIIQSSGQGMETVVVEGQLAPGSMGDLANIEQRVAQRGR